MDNRSLLLLSYQRGNTLVPFLDVTLKISQINYSAVKFRECRRNHSPFTFQNEANAKLSPITIGDILMCLNNWHHSRALMWKKCLIYFLHLFQIYAVCFVTSAFAELPLTIGLLVSGTQSEADFAARQLKNHLKIPGVRDAQVISILPLVADNDLTKLPALARNLIDKKPSLLVANSHAAASALAKATTAIPIVFVSASDPVAEKLVNSLNRPGGNITGIFDYLDLDPKLTETACRWLAKDRRIAFVFFAGEKASPDFNAITAASTAQGCKVDFVAVHDFTELKSTLLARKRNGQFAVVMPMNFVFFKHSQAIIEFLNAEKIPAVYERASSAVG
jgi:putative tryptophan/tyrosine transport system substrate-binding protein